MNSKETQIIIGLVGPCKSGKTLLKRGLSNHGFRVKHIAQEHSYVPDMWRKIAKPDILIYLNVSFEATLRRSALNWSESEYNRQVVRLEHAYQHADLIINTDDLTPNQVLTTAVSFLDKALPSS